jgi:uncharacterized protein
MLQINSLANQGQSINKKMVISVIVFLLVAIAGLSYVKWWPYYQKAIVAATNHSIGSSIVTGKNPSAPAPSWDSAWQYAMAYYKSVWKAALLGILLGSLLQVLIPAQWLLKVIGRANFKSTVVAGLASIPAMMCTCCAAPIAVGLRKKNSSVGASLAFWIGNPTLNPATLVFMTFVLSWKFTLLRLFFGLILTFGVSYFANRFASETKSVIEIDSLQEQAAESQSRPIWLRWVISIWSLILHVVPAYIISVLLLGAFRAWMFPALGDTASGSILFIIGFAIVGMLFVIPTAGEIPIIQTMMSFGLGTGPAAALLLTLPSISLPSLLMIHRFFPKKVLLIVAFSVVLLGIICGLAGAIFL